MKEQSVAAFLGMPKDIGLKKAVEVALAFWAPTQTVQSTRDKNRRILGVMVRLLGANTPVSSVTREDIVKIVHYCQKRGNEPFLYLRIVRHFFSLMEQEGICQINPVQYRRLPFTIRPYKVKPLITEEQYRALMQECLHPRYHDYWPTMFMIAWETGLRCIDAGTIKWGYHEKGSYVDLDAELIVARPKKKECRRERLEIPIGGELLEHLRELYQKRDPDSPYVMPMLALTWVYGQAQAPRTAIRKIFNNCGMPEHSFHCFRHTFVSRLVKAGVNPIVISEMTGQTISMIQRYSRVSNDDKRNALDVIRNASHALRLKSLGYTPPEQT